MILNSHTPQKLIDIPGPHFKWPIITEATKLAILQQIEASISIYDRSGIFKEFEDKWSSYHKRKHSIVYNSGTSALYSAFRSLNLSSGDEIISPVYTFFATISPVISMGVQPVFCDCDSTGNIDPVKIESCITKNTKALVITHMWGLPCDMDKIIKICQKYNLFLIEDCSHAHGALYHGVKVGSFGDIAVWSLQGQKIITGGEGGILSTNNSEIYEKCLLHGHFNKRCIQEVTSANLKEFALTGAGLKLRAHPLAIAMANEQFTHLDGWIAQKNLYALQIIQELSGQKSLEFPRVADTTQPSWYAMPIKYFASKNDNIPLEELVHSLHLMGLTDIDIPRSTMPLNNLKIFTNPTELYPDVIPIDRDGFDFENAYLFYNLIFKIPVWTRVEDKHFVDAYIKGIKMLCK